MKVGVNLINFGPSASPEALARWAGLAEALGYHFIAISDHVAITPDVEERYPAPFYDPFLTLAWLSGITKRIELGTTVIIVPYRHPLETARLAAGVDRLSGGRLILGVGVGWAKQEFDALRVPFERRGAITNEYLAAMKTCWTDEVASFNGRFVSFADVRTAPRPLRSPHPPIWVGGASDAALTRAVRYGDGWHPIRFRVDWLRDRALPRLVGIAEREGRPVPALCPRMKFRLTASPAPDGTRLAGEGTVDQVRTDLETLAALGASHVLLDTYFDDPEATRRPEAAWRMLATAAERLFDLERQTLR
jgi:probable F420-dependent oxidoreductase